LLVELASQTGLPFRVFSLDTGRLHAETYEFFEQVEQHYGINIEYTFPESSDVTNLVQKKGMFSFFKDGHQECCGARKVKPLRKKLSTLNAWVTGVRADQSQTRTGVPKVQSDPAFKGSGPEDSLVKWNPLADLTSSEVWTEIREGKVPYNSLHDKGFVSIGCGPCTRPVNPSMHEREGRWWWEDAKDKECGLHASKEDQHKFVGKMIDGDQPKESLDLETPAINTMKSQSVRWGASVKLVKKVLEDGEFCRKCKQVSEMLEKSGLDEMLAETVVADVNDPASEGMELARKHDVSTAPFFIVAQDGHPDKVLKTYHEARKLLMEMKEQQEQSTQSVSA